MTSLDIQTDNILDGKYQVDWTYLNDSFDRQIMRFGAQNLEIASPAILGAMRVGKPRDHPFYEFSRTNKVVISRPGTADHVIMDGKVLGKVYASAMVAAHRQNEEYLVPKEDLEFVCDIVATALNDGSALRVDAGNKIIPTKEFAKHDISEHMFSDLSLGIKSQDYGDSLCDGLGLMAVTFIFTDKKYVKAQTGSYMNMVCVFDPRSYCNVGNCYFRYDDNDGAFGAKVEPTVEQQLHILAEKHSHELDFLYTKHRMAQDHDALTSMFDNLRADLRKSRDSDKPTGDDTK